MWENSASAGTGWYNRGDRVIVMLLPHMAHTPHSKLILSNL